LPEVDWRYWRAVLGSKKGWQKEKHELHDVLYRWSQQECRDTQDRIYGLLGLVSKPELRVDFTKSPLDLFGDLLRLERRKIYAYGYEYAEDFATKLLNSLRLSDNKNAKRLKTEFLKWCTVLKGMHNFLTTPNHNNVETAWTLR
jgi:hypothetical protein